MISARGCRTELRLAPAIAASPVLAGRYIRRFGGVMVPFIIISLWQVSISAWFIHRIVLLEMAGWKVGLLVLIPTKTLLLLTMTSAFMWTVIRGERAVLTFRTCMSAIVRCAYAFIVGQIAVTGAMAVIPALGNSVQPLPVPGLASFVHLSGIAGEFAAEATLSAIWFMVSLSFVLKGMTGWGTRRSFLVGGVTWGFLAAIRVLVRALASGGFS